MERRYQPGDPVIFTMSKVSTDPGPRATDIHPAAHGETYSYYVPKFWRVETISDDGSITLVTRRGKRHTLTASDPRLRHATFWEKWIYAQRFPSLSAAQPTSGTVDSR